MNAAAQRLAEVTLIPLLFATANQTAQEWAEECLAKE
jgi:hypothetical protein